MPPKRKREDTSSNTRRIDWATIDDKHSFPGFTLKALRTKTTKSPTQPKKKQKTDTSADTTASYKDAPLDAEIVQPNPFPGAELSETHYQVEPVAEWESTQRYRKFTVSNAEFEVGQTIFVNKEETIVDTDDVKQFWVARVLEVRAGDSQHVYLRLYWLYWPEDLPGGRQLHHGENELIASNDMALVDALTVVDSADVMHWEEDPENTDWPLRDQLFWRQTLDTEKPKAQQLSVSPTNSLPRNLCTK